ncbi:MAG: InlB B-repeat-containing protein [Clostridia bacterium]|nr:InlB B-repeat-containing protein [Clostridia bacterium]
MQEIKEIKLIFDPGKGAVDIKSVTAVCGDRIGAMPAASRRGYVFGGWYTAQDGQGERLTAESVTPDLSGGTLTLYAYWQKPETGKAKKKSSLASQKKAIWALVIVAAVLIAGLVFTNYIIDIYHYEDYDGVTYTIKKKDGAYGLYHKSGPLCDVNDDGYYLTTLGTQLDVDPATGEYEIYAVVDVEGTEVVGVSQRVLAFKQLTYDKSSTTDMTRVISRYEIHNQNGDFVLIRQEGTNRFTIEGHEGTLMSDELFAQLSVGCGYTISMQRLANPERLADGSIDWAEYGLAPEVRTKKNDDGTDVADENGDPVTYDYEPTWYVVSTLQPDARTGLSDYKMTIGDATVSGAGYYARYEDRETIYILSSTNLDAAVLQPVETLVTPMIVYPMSMNSYFDVHNFILEHIDTDFRSLYLGAAAAGLDADALDLRHPETLTEEQINAIVAGFDKLSDMDEETFSALYERADALARQTVTGFSFVSISSRENTLYSSIPYRMSTDYMAGYQPNANNISTLMQKLYSMAFLGVTKLGPDEDELDEYGILDAAWHLTFTYHDTAGIDHDNEIWISAMTEEGTYYAYSEMFDMIVCFDESEAPYLEWETMDWYEREYYSYNIAHVDTLTLEGAGVTALGQKYLNGDGKIVYTLDNTASDQTTAISSAELKVALNGKPLDYKLQVTKPSGTKTEEDAVYNFRRLIQSLLTASLEGVADLSEQEMAELRTTPDTDCQLKITVILNDHYTSAAKQKYVKAVATALDNGVDPSKDESVLAAKTAMENAVDSKMNLVYRFYRITERRSYMTIEVLPTPDSPSAPENGQGMFYVLRSFCDKIVADAARLNDQIEIDPDSKN